MKKIYGEFKKFISRGNIVDMAVGVIVGSSFTAIVNGLSNFILKPLINWLLATIFGADSLSEIYTILKPAYDDAGAIDLANSIYIDWGSFINAIINFLLVATVLFAIVKIFNTLREQRDKLVTTIKSDIPTKAEKKEMKKLGINLFDPEAVHKYLTEKHKKEAEAEAAAKEAEKLAAEEAARLEREANPTAEDLLKEIRDILKNK